MQKALAREAEARIVLRQMQMACAMRMARLEVKDYRREMKKLEHEYTMLVSIKTVTEQEVGVAATWKQLKGQHGYKSKARRQAGAAEKASK